MAEQMFSPAAPSSTTQLIMLVAAGRMPDVQAEPSNGDVTLRLVAGVTATFALVGPPELLDRVLVDMALALSRGERTAPFDDVLRDIRRRMNDET